jgi:molybdenum cofactor biosynthesis enzyme MoaA
VPTFDFANILFSGPCNLRCPYCIGKQVDPVLNRDNLSAFPLRSLGRFVALLQQYRVRQLVFTGTTTDPQLYRHEAQLIAWLREKLPGVQFSLHTNGQLALAKMAVLNQYDRVSISLPSFDSTVYEQMTGSRRVPDLAAILKAARVPIKLSCVLDQPNISQLGSFLARCHTLGVHRIALRRLYGDRRHWELPHELRLNGNYRDNPVYEYQGMEVTYWDFERTSSTSLNLFADGTISEEYLLTKRAG